MTNEKKKSLILIISISVILVILLGILLVIEFKSKNVSSKLLNNFYERYNSKNVEVIYYESSQCGYCSLETPILENISKDYDMDYLQIDITKLNKSEREEIANKLDIEGATPSTVVVKNGKVISKQEGYLDGTEYVKFFIEAGVLKSNSIYSEEANLTFIDYSKYKELVYSTTPVAIVIGQTGCSHCISTKPVLNKIAKKFDIEINYLNITNLEETDYNEMITNLQTFGYDEANYVSEKSIGTPTTFIFKDGKVIDYIAGETTNSKYIKLFQKNAIITE